MGFVQFLGAVERGPTHDRHSLALHTILDIPNDLGG